MLSVLRSVRGIGQVILVSPLATLFLFTDRDTARADAGRWLAIDSGTRDAFDSPVASHLGVLRMLGKYREFRTLFYWRSSSRGSLGKLLCRIARILWPGATGLQLHAKTIGPGLYIQHGFGSLVHAGTIGRDCWINQHVTVESSRVKGPTNLGDRVYLRVGVVLIGGLSIGSDTEIGANSVVTKDVPSGTIAVGAPARTIKPNPRLRNPPSSQSPG